MGPTIKDSVWGLQWENQYGGLQWETQMGDYGAYIGRLNMGPTVGDWSGPLGRLTGGRTIFKRSSCRSQKGRFVGGGEGGGGGGEVQTMLMNMAVINLFWT